MQAMPTRGIQVKIIYYKISITTYPSVYTFIHLFFLGVPVPDTPDNIIYKLNSPAVYVMLIYVFFKFCGRVVFYEYRKGTRRQTIASVSRHCIQSAYVYMLVCTYTSFLQYLLCNTMHTTTT